MRAAVLINGRAGQADRSEIEVAIRRALFRLDLQFYAPGSTSEMQVQIRELVRRPPSERPEALLICGGDGTLNASVQPLMESGDNGMSNPPAILPIPVGTANDLASELGLATNLSRRIERAARMLLTGEIRHIDVLKVEGHRHSDPKSIRTAYMTTNGGLGLPAETADRANEVRSRAQSNWARSAFRFLGGHIYEALLARELIDWDSATWHVEIEFMDAQGSTWLRRSTKSPFIMVNNQPLIASKFLSAPLTDHTDDHFSVLTLETTNRIRLLQLLLEIRSAKIPDPQLCPNQETAKARFTRLAFSRPLTFFGDGEILLRDEDTITVTCLPRRLPVIAYSGGEL